MKKFFMLLVLGGLMACASIYAQDEEDFKIKMDDEESTYPIDEEDNFKIGYVDDWPGEE